MNMSWSGWSWLALSHLTGNRVVEVYFNLRQEVKVFLVDTGCNKCMSQTVRRVCKYKKKVCTKANEEGRKKKKSLTDKTNIKH